MSPKHCPHCKKRIPWRKRLRRKCPFCFKPFRRRSLIQDRSLLGQWLEDRSMAFWFWLILLLLVIAAIIMQLCGNPDLLRFIDHRPFWFVLTVLYAAMMMSMIGRIFFPLLLDAPRILHRERPVIRQYRVLTIAGALIGIPLAILFVGWHNVWLRLPGTVFLISVPIVLLWAYHALTLTEDDYDDARVYSFLQEIGAQDRLEHRHHAYMVLFGLPLALLLFYYFSNYPWLARMIRESSESGLIAMFLDLYRRATGRG